MLDLVGFMDWCGIGEQLTDYRTSPKSFIVFGMTIYSPGIFVLLDTIANLFLGGSLDLFVVLLQFYHSMCLDFSEPEITPLPVV